MRIITTLAACAAFAFIFSSCGKDDSAAKPADCTLIKSYLYDSGAPTDSLEYGYTGNSITKVLDKNNNAYHTLEYNSNNKVTKQNFFEPISATAPYAYTAVSYNSDGSISKLEVFEVTGPGTNSLRFNQIFTYTGGKLTSEVTNEITNGVAEKIEQHVYTWTGNNVTKDVVTYYDAGVPEVETNSFSYDSKENYFKKDGTNQIFTAAAGADMGISPLAQVLNANNVTGMTYSGFPITLDYTLDGRSNVTMIKALGQPVFGFVYYCP